MKGIELCMVSGVHIMPLFQNSGRYLGCQESIRMVL